MEKIMQTLTRTKTSNPNIEYFETERETMNDWNQSNKKSELKMYIAGTVTVLFTVTGFVGAITSKHPIENTFLGALPFIFIFLSILLAAYTMSFVVLAPIAPSLGSVQKRFLNRYELEITDSELSQLNFPTLGKVKKEGLRGTANAFNRRSNTIQEVTLYIDSSGQFVLYDKKGKKINSA